MNGPVRICAALAGYVLLGVGGAIAAVPGRPASAPAAAPGFALLELYTSEGCSSCPPADALLAKLADARGHVYALSFHVDYWDRLGWQDRFSSAAWTDRQRAYARRFELASLYTPELVVNGSVQMVGSDAVGAERAVRAALANGARVPVAVEAGAHGLDVEAHCRVASAPPGAVLRVAWADASAASAPSAGENRGRALHHVNVVRDLRTVPLAAAFDGAVRLHRPEARAGSVVAWVQAGDGPVLGAAAAGVGDR